MKIVRNIVGLKQEIEYDKTKPNGTFRKLIGRYKNKIFRLDTENQT